MTGSWHSDILGALSYNFQGIKPLLGSSLLDFRKFEMMATNTNYAGAKYELEKRLRTYMDCFVHKDGQTAIAIHIRDLPLTRNTAAHR